MSRRCVAAVIALAAASALAGAGAAQESGTLVLDETAYWRYYVQFGPDRLDSATLKAEGERLLGQDLPKVEKAVKRYFEPPFVEPAERKDWSKADWRDEPLYFISQAFNVGTDDEASWRRIFTPPPANDWMAPDFNDGDWFRQRLPLLVGRLDLSIPTQLHGNSTRQTGVRRACYRTTFEVPDPAAAGTYTIQAEFRGGLRVFVNGKEAGRAFVSGGQAGAAAAAQAYPVEAYVFLEGERPQKTRQNVVSKAGRDFGQDLPPTFPAPAPGKGAADPDVVAVHDGWGLGDISYGRKGWERITQLRNRRLAPLAIPKELLRKGANVLAVELIASDLNPVVGPCRQWQSCLWEHARLYELKLTCSSAAPTAFGRPKGVQVWVEDIHRRAYSADFGPGSSVGVLRMVGAPNGTYGGQIIVGSDGGLSGVKVTPGDLKADGGATIPASAMRIGLLQAHPVNELVNLGQGRNFPEHRAEPLCPSAKVAVQRFGSARGRAVELPRQQQLEEIAKLQFFDHIVGAAGGAGGLPQGSVSPANSAPAPGTAALPSVPPDSCQPIWLSLTIPDGTPPGTYQGQVKVEAAGTAVNVPMTVEVFGWRVPDPGDFQTVMALEQSPYGVAKQYKVPLWSDEHFRYMEESFRQLGRVGNNWLFIPVLKNTEFGNRGDSMIRWVRKSDGAWSFDYAVLDRYLALACKYLGGAAPTPGADPRPRVIAFVVMHGGDSYGTGAKAEVDYFDQAAGKQAGMVVNAELAAPGVWKAFATSLYAHMQSLGLERSMYWGYGWDANGDGGMIPLLARYTPSVKWTRGAHGLGSAGADETFTAASRIYGVQLATRSQRGWAGKYTYLLLPRSGSSIMSCNGHSPPFAFRLMVDRALVSGLGGIARLGADYWANSFFEGAPVPNYAVGMPCVQMLWPGQRGAEPSARFEVLREGVQETEARIFLEQALAGNRLPPELAKSAEQVLFEHNQATLYVSVGTVSEQTHEYSTGWQERSRRLYRVAGEAAAAVGLDADRLSVALDAPVRGRTAAALRLRNWTAQPRSFKAAGDQPWLTPEKSEGVVARGQQGLTVFVDGDKLPVGQPGKGNLTITDATTGQAVTVAFTASPVGAIDLVVGEAYDFLGSPAHASAFQPRRVEDHAVFNVPVGGNQTKEFTLANRTGDPMNWKIESPDAWLTASPAGGTLKPRERTFVRLTVAPTDAAAATHETGLTVAEGGGPARQQVKIITHVIPPYVAPRETPKGQAVAAGTLTNKDTVALHKSRAYWFGSSDPRREDYGPRYQADGSIKCGIPQITAYNIAGKGFTGFSAKAVVEGPAVKDRNPIDDPERWINFEIHVDGKVLAQTGLMKLGDGPRLLAVEGLKDAKELKLIIRFDTDEPKNLLGRMGASWGAPTLYKAP